jgi:hypothetical protein
MKRTPIILILSLLAISPLLAQNNGPAAANAPGSVERGALQRLFLELQRPDGRIHVLAAMTGAPAEKLKKAEEIRVAAERELRADQAEIEVRKAQLTRVLIDTHPNMADVQKYLREGADWEYKMRLAQIERDLHIRGLLGDSDWSRYQAGVRLLDRLDGRGLRQPGTRSAEPLSTAERELLLRLQSLGPQTGNQGN